MKKVTLILVFIGMFIFQSCVREEILVDDHDTISEVFEYSGVDFYSGNSYKAVLDFPYTIYSSDMVLVYRLVGYGSSGDLWKPLPETYYFNNGTLDFGYKNDFTRYDAEVSLYGYDLFNLPNADKLDQVFRVVVIPAYQNNKMSTNVDFNDYSAVIQHYGINENKITKIKM